MKDMGSSSRTMGTASRGHAPREVAPERVLHGLKPFTTHLCLGPRQLHVTTSRFAILGMRASRATATSPVAAMAVDGVASTIAGPRC